MDLCIYISFLCLFLGYFPSLCSVPFQRISICFIFLCFILLLFHGNPFVYLYGFLTFIENGLFSHIIYPDYSFPTSLFPVSSHTPSHLDPSPFLSLIRKQTGSVVHMCIQHGDLEALLAWCSPSLLAPTFFSPLQWGVLSRMFQGF